MNTEEWTILLVEDNAEDREALCRFLLQGSDRRRYRFLEAQTAKEALARLRRASPTVPELILLDYHLPDGNAPELIPDLLAELGVPICPIVVVTGSDQPQVGSLSLKAGAHDFIGKNWLTPESLTRTIENAVERWQMARKLAAASDVREKLVAELQKSIHYYDLFIGILSHDLRNPLTGIRTAVELGTKEGGDPNSQRLFSIIGSSSDRMTRMVEQLLDITRMRAGGGLEIVRKSMDLKPTVERIISELTVGEANQQIEFIALGNTIGAWDEDRLSQLISNLAGNALQHGKENGMITIHLDGSRTDAVELRCSNLGAIPEELRLTLFDPFAHSAKIRSRGAGLGLGLYIARQIAEVHGGKLDVTSNPAAGTCFTLHLPR